MKKINVLTIGTLSGLLSLSPLAVQARSNQLVNVDNPYPGLAYFDDQKTHTVTIPCMYVSTRDHQGNPVNIADANGVTVYQGIFKQDPANPGLFDLQSLSSADPVSCYDQASKSRLIHSASLSDMSMLVYVMTAMEKESYFAVGFDILVTPEIKLGIRSLDLIDRKMLNDYSLAINGALGGPYPANFLCTNPLLNIHKTSYFPGQDDLYDDYYCGMTLFSDGSPDGDVLKIPVAALSNRWVPAIAEDGSADPKEIEVLTKRRSSAEVIDPNEDLWWGRDSSGRESVFGYEAWDILRYDAASYLNTHNVSSTAVDALYASMLMTGEINPFGAGQTGTYEKARYQLIAEVGDDLVMKNGKTVSGEHAKSAVLTIETESPIQGMLSFRLTAMPDGSTREIEIPLKARHAGPGILHDSYRMDAGEYKNGKVVGCSNSDCLRSFDPDRENNYGYSAQAIFFGLNAQYAVVTIGLSLQYEGDDSWHYPTASGTLILERVDRLTPYFR